MRIISGEYKGTRLAKLAPGIRPTTDRARETLFNVLGETVVGSSWIDAYAGSGAIGLEALSRGARWVVFNDKSPVAVRLIHTNLNRCGVQTGFQVLNHDAFTLFNQFRGQPMDFVFLDPPYGFTRHSKLLGKVAETVSEPKRTLVIVEIFKKTPVEISPRAWHLVRTLEVGDSHFLFLRLTEEDTHPATE